MKTKFILIASIVTLFLNQSFADDYPKSRIEREMDEMGSGGGLTGGGMIFRPGKEKSVATKTTIGNVNKYLFQASIDVLKFAPLVSADNKIGTIITGWHSPKDQKNTQFKVTVYIKDQLITPEGIEVIAFQRKKINGKWSVDQELSPIAPILEDKIIRKARALYLQSIK